MITIDNLLNSDDLSTIQQALTEASWVSGEHSAGEHARTRKHNEEMNQSCTSWSTINQLVASKLYAHPEFQNIAVPSKLSAAFVSKCLPGMYYGTHTDDPVMGTPSGRYRCDVAITVFISAPEYYQGGELTIHTNFGSNAVTARAGSAVVYPASSRHEVSPVTSGERIVCVLWAQSLIRDPARREILADLNNARQALRLTAPEADVTQSVDHAYMNLVRMWAEV